MRSPSTGQCPNCAAQLVIYPWGFACSVCNYDHKQYAAHVPEDYPMHTDSPALVT